MQGVAEEEESSDGFEGGKPNGMYGNGGRWVTAEASLNESKKERIPDAIAETLNYNLILYVSLFSN